MKADRNAAPPAPGSLRASVAIVAWGLAVWAAIAFAASFLARNAMAAAGVQAGLAEWGTGRMGVFWSDPDGPPQAGKDIARRLLVGAGCGALVALTALGAALVARTSSFSPGPPSFDALAVGLVVAVLGATRDELVLRGMTLRATRDHWPPWGGWLACGLAAAAAKLGGSEAVAPVAIAAEALRGVALGPLWTRDRGAWMAWGANVGWTWTEGCVARGGLIDLRFASDRATDGPTLAVLAVAVILAWLGSTRWLPRPAPANSSP